MLVGLTIVAAPAGARTIYVRTTGSDGLDGSTPGLAVRTLGRAGSLARSGDDIVVGPGVYREGDLHPGVFGHVRYVADRRGLATGEPAGPVVIDATGFSSGFELNDQLAVTIDGFVIHGATNGLYVKSQSHQAVLANNVVSNVSGNGIYIQDSEGAVVFNNLVYNNARTGILVTGNVSGSARARLLNNTVYQNGNRGIFFSGTTVGSPSGLVLNNILQGNANAGIQVNASSRDGYLSAGNVLFDNRFAAGTPADVTDITADPGFVNPTGPDGILGGDGFADDSFHLSDRGAGQATTSAAVDAGSDVARRLSLYYASTRTDGGKDRGYVDAGYHYANFNAPPAKPSARIRTRRLYVSLRKGSDSNDGGTRSTPVRSLEKALQLAQPGHEIRLLSGTYREGETVLTSSESGKPGRPLLVKGIGEVVFDAGGAARGFTLTGISDIVLDGIAVTGAVENGIEIRNSMPVNPADPTSRSIVLRRCRVFGNGNRGVAIRNSSRVGIDTCRIEANGVRGMQIEASEARIGQSIVRANGTTGLWAFGGSSVQVAHTDFVDNPQEGILVEGSALSHVGGRISGGKEGGARFKERSTGLLEDVVVEANEDLGVQAFASTVRVVDSQLRGGRVSLLASRDPSLDAPSELTVEGCDIGFAVASGIDAADTTLAVRNSTVHDNGSDGVRQDGGVTTVTASILDGNRGVGLRLRDVSSASVIDVEVANNEEDGVQIANSRARVETAEIHDNGRTGLWASEGAIVDLDRTNLLNNPSEGVLAQGSEVNLYGGTLRGSREGGARYLNGSAGEIQNVVVANNADAGIVVISSAVDVIGATIQNNGKGILGDVDPNAMGSNRITIEDAMVCDNDASGIDVTSTSLGLRDAIVCSNGDDGLRYKGGSVSVENCAFGDNGGRGVSITDADPVALRKIVLARNAGNGLQAIQSLRVTVSEADVLDNIGDGMTFTDSVVQSVSSAKVQRNSGSGILASYSGSPYLLVVRDTQVLDNGQYGLRVLGGGLTVATSRMENNGGDGISLADLGQVSVTDTLSLGNRGNGLELIGARSATFQQVSLTGNLGNGLRATDANVARLENVEANDNGAVGAAILANPVAEGPLVVRQSEMRDNGQEGLRLTGGNVAIETSQFTDNGSDGASLGGMGTVTGTEIAATGNGVQGVQVATAQSVTLAHLTAGDNRGDGVLLSQVQATHVDNALFHTNGSTGLRIAGGSILSPAATILGSTFYGNGNRGFFLDGNLAAPADTKVVVMRNIFRANANAGVQVNTAPLVDYQGDYNLSTDPYGAQTPVGAHDVLQDPRFLDTDARNFRLAQQSAGQTPTSPAVDAGDISASAAGMATRTTRSDNQADSGLVDLGYHYPRP